MRTQEKYQNFTDEQLFEILSNERESAALKIQVGFKNKGNTKKARDEGIGIYVRNVGFKELEESQDCGEEGFEVEKIVGGGFEEQIRGNDRGGNR